MLRAVLLGLLAVSATSSCGGGSDTAKVAPGAVAGKVLEASGNVAATRGGATRALAAGAEVFADDVVDTANGSVVILLHHNNARWAVESGQRTRVDESLAWKLAKQASPAKVVDHASSAAGREGERTAADTRATSEAPGAAGAAAENTSAESAAAPPVAAATSPAPEAPQPPAVPQPPTAPPGTGEAVAGKGGGDRGGGPRIAPRNEKEDKKAVTDSVSSPEPRDAVAMRPPPASRLGGELEARRAELRRCLTGKLALTLVVRVDNGAPAIELTGGAPDAKVRACLERVVKKIPTSGLAASASIRLVR